MDAMRGLIVKGKYIKIFFKYPEVDKLIIKSGLVLETSEDSFILEEVKDGVSGYSYDYVIEVREDGK